METFVRRQLWILDLVAILVGAAFAGHAAAMLIAAALPLQPAAVAARRAPAPSRAPVPSGEKSIDGIVGRNIFCSTCGDTPIPERSRRAYTLLAIMLAPRPADARWSVAIIRDDEAATVGPYGAGDRLGEATIAAIEAVRVVLDVGRGRRELLELLERRPPTRSDGAVSRANAFADGVRKTAAHAYEVRRAVVDRLLGGGIIPPWPRVVPQARDGQAIGFRLAGVRPDSPFAAIGLTDGDLLLAVNARSIATPDAAMAAFATLRTENHIWLEIERDGRRIRIDYHLVR